jgi:SAM-dependent methyltransferase
MSIKEVDQTKQSFDYQWKNLDYGHYLISDPNWKPEEYICQEIDKPKEWFEGKRILDVGCGSGRWSIGFQKLGCELVSIDQSISAVEKVKLFGIDARHYDIFDITKENLGEFDLVWSWGVLHHTGKTKLAFEKISDLVKDQGILHVMIYNKKPKRVKIIRKLMSPFGFSKKIKFIRLMMWFVRRHRAFRLIFPVYPNGVHMNFDALSPSINSEHSEDEVRGFFEEFGYSNIERKYPSWIYNKANPNTDIIMNGLKSNN